jgi:hypothetical protein
VGHKKNTRWLKVTLAFDCPMALAKKLECLSALAEELSAVEPALPRLQKWPTIDPIEGLAGMAATLFAKALARVEPKHIIDEAKATCEESATARALADHLAAHQGFDGLSFLGEPNAWTAHVAEGFARAVNMDAETVAEHRRQLAEAGSHEKARGLLMWNWFMVKFEKRRFKHVRGWVFELPPALAMALHAACNEVMSDTFQCYGEPRHEVIAGADTCPFAYFPPIAGPI